MTLDGAPQPAAALRRKPVTQPVAAPLTAAAIFLVVTVRPGQDSERPSATCAVISAACCVRSVSATSKPP